MALYDHRVFRTQGEWWVAQVHGGGGAAWGDGPTLMTHDSVFFTSLSDVERKTVVATIPSGWLNQLSHAALMRVLDSASEFGTRFDMRPYNAPSKDELGKAKLKDNAGLEWTYRQTRVVRSDEVGKPVLSDAVELICLDDSALRKEVLLAGPSVLDDFIRQNGEEAISELIEFAKGTYRDYRPPRHVSG